MSDDLIPFTIDEYRLQDDIGKIMYRKWREKVRQQDKENVKKIYNKKRNLLYTKKMREYRQNHPEQIKTTRRNYYLKNKERLKQQHQKWYNANKDKVSLLCKNYYAKNKTKILEYHRQKYINNKTKKQERNNA